MDLSRFKELYERVGFWAFWMGVLTLAVAAYGLFLVFAKIVGPYAVGMWLIYG
jgi:hypothetical protein